MGKKKGGAKAKPAPAAKAPEPPKVVEPEPVPEQAPEKVPEPVAEAAPAEAPPAEVAVESPAAVSSVAGAFDLCDAVLKISEKEKGLKAVHKAAAGGEAVPDSVLGVAPSPAQTLCFQLAMARHSASFEGFAREVKGWGAARALLASENVEVKQLVEYLGVSLDDDTMAALVDLLHALCAGEGASAVPALVELLERLCPTRKSAQDVCVLMCTLMEAVAWGEGGPTKERIEAAVVKLTAYQKGTMAAPVVCRGQYDEFIALVKQWTDDDLPDDSFFHQVARFLPKEAGSVAAA